MGDVYSLGVFIEGKEGQVEVEDCWIALARKRE